MGDTKRSTTTTRAGGSREGNAAGQHKDSVFTDISAVKHLKALHIEAQKIKYAHCPYPSSPDFKVNSANGITQAEIHFLKLRGHQAERISNTGRYIDNSKIVTDVMGHRRKIGSGQWIPGTGTAGTADISATIKNKEGIGISVKIEVKFGKDRQSDAQRKYEAEVISAGGIYHVSSSFCEFLTWYYSTFEKEVNNE